MARRKSVCLKWTLVLFVVIFCPFVNSRPQDASSPNTTTNSVYTEKPTENPIRESITTKQATTKKTEDLTTSAPVTSNAPRNNQNKPPIIGEAIKMVANQLLENPTNKTVETPVVIDTRIPPKLKPIVQKHKLKTRNEDGDQPLDNSHPGVAVPVTMEELETENKISESSTSNEGISTWILLTNTNNKENSSSTEAPKVEDSQKKQKPGSKNKTKRPPNNKNGVGKRPIIGSTNKSDLVAGGSAINENIYNKIKDTVLSNVQKNKNQSSQKVTTVSTTITTSTTESPVTEFSTTKKEVSQVTKAPAPVVKVTSKPAKKKNKHKNKATSTTPSTVNKESALLPMEPKEQEIELEISTPATTTKKPKRAPTRKKNKTKKRKTSKPKPEATTISEVKTSNSTKTKKTKTNKKPDLTSITGPITSSIYSYFSREVMPTVGVGVLGLASLVGLAGYFLYPFATPVRRTFEVDKKDDIYRHNAEEYANEGNGQAEEEMLGTVLAGMPAHSKHKMNPYAGQTTHINRYPAKKEQDIRYRHVATGSPGYEPNYNVHYPQQKTGIAHGAVYSEQYSPHLYETRHIYTTEGQYVYNKGPSGYTPHPAPIEPIYASPQTGPQTGPSGISGYGSDASNSVVYGVKPSPDSDFKPVYPFDTQFYSETTSSPMTYPPTSMYLGSNNDADDQDEQNYPETSETNNESDENKFVVGNVPKELSETATPAVVPEHGPRNLRRRRNLRHKRSITTKIEEILKEAKDKNNEIFISNEIDETLGNPVKNLAPSEDIMMKNDVTTISEIKDVYTVFPVTTIPVNEEKITETPTTEKIELIESVSTVPVDNNKDKPTTESFNVNELETTTKSFRVYEVFSSVNPDVTDQSSAITNPSPKAETSTQFKNMNTETTTELKSETTSTMPPSPSPVFSTTFPSFTTNNPEVLTYPPLNEGGFFTFLKRLIEFKYRLGLSILQTTSENLNRYLRSMEHSVKKVAKAST